MRFALILESYNELRSRLLDFLQPKNKEEEKKGASVEAEKLGSGRVIPIKQVQIHQLSALTSKPYIMKRFHLEEVCFITGKDRMNSGYWPQWLFVLGIPL